MVIRQLESGHGCPVELIRRQELLYDVLLWEAGIRRIGTTDHNAAVVEKNVKCELATTGDESIGEIDSAIVPMNEIMKLADIELSERDVDGNPTEELLMSRLEVETEDDKAGKAPELGDDKVGLELAREDEGVGSREDTDVIEPVPELEDKDDKSDARVEVEDVKISIELVVDDDPAVDTRLRVDVALQLDMPTLLLEAPELRTDAIMLLVLEARIDYVAEDVDDESVLDPEWLDATFELSEDRSNESVCKDESKVGTEAEPDIVATERLELREVSLNKPRRALQRRCD